MRTMSEFRAHVTNVGGLLVEGFREHRVLQLSEAQAREIATLIPERFRPVVVLNGPDSFVRWKAD